MTDICVKNHIIDSFKIPTSSYNKEEDIPDVEYFNAKEFFPDNLEYGNKLIYKTEPTNDSEPIIQCRKNYVDNWLGRKSTFSKKIKYKRQNAF